jgi:hypothetical protein
MVSSDLRSSTADDPRRRKGRNVERVTELRTLHFALPYLTGDEPVSLHVGTRRHPLQPHTEQTRAAARDRNGSLRLIPDDELTHVVEDVELPSDQAQLLFVTTPPAPGDVLPIVHLTKVHVPLEARRAEAKRRAPTGHRRPIPRLAFAGTVDPPTLIDDTVNHALPVQVDDWTSAMDAAVQTIFQHLELISIDPTTAATVLQIIEYADGTSDLASQIAQQAYAAYNDPSVQNWVYETPYIGLDGTPTDLQRYLWSDVTQQWMPGPMKDALKTVKNTPSLQSTSTVAGSYTVQSGVTAVTSVQDASPAGPAPGPHHVTAATQDDGDGGTWTVNDLTPQNGFVYENDLSFENNVFSASFSNQWQRWLSGYVEFLGPDGQPVVPDGWQSQLPDGVPIVYDSDTTKYVALFSAVDTILSVPVDASPTTISFPWPSNASAVRVLAGGLGRTDGVAGQNGTYYGSWNSQVCAGGTLMTGVFNFGIPVVSLAVGAAIPQAGLSDLASNFAGTILDVGSALVNGPIAGAFSGESLDGILIAFADAMPHLLLDAPGLAAAIAAYIGVEDAVDEAIPVFGWIALGVSVVTTISDLTQTTLELAASPATFEVVFTRTVDATWTLLPDAQHQNTWPLEATSYSVTATFTDGTTRITTGQMGESPQYGPLTVSFSADAGNALPAGGTVTFSATFFSATGWICGAATSDPMNADVGGTLTVPEQAITENEIPLTAETRYGYKQSLTWDAADQQHVWSDDARPSATIGSLDPSNAGATIGALGQITVDEDQSQLGYDWQASGQGLPVTGGSGSPTDEQLYAFQTVSTQQSPEDGLQFVPSGFVDQTPIAFGLQSPASGDQSTNFYVDPTDQVYALRQVTLTDAAGTFALPQGVSWGRFNEPIDACTIHPSGYAVGVNTANAKLEVVALPSAATADAESPLAEIYAGYGDRPGLLHEPVGVAPSVGSGVIVLESTDSSFADGGGAARVQAFDLRGNPAPIFTGGTSVAPLKTETQPVTALALATESQGYIYVLKYLGDGATADDYRLDVYSPEGVFLSQTPGLPAGSIAVDLWRTLYTLDYAQIAKPAGQRPEPSVSWWVPSTPT